MNRLPVPAVLRKPRMSVLFVHGQGTHEPDKAAQDQQRVVDSLRRSFAAASYPLPAVDYLAPYYLEHLTPTVWEQFPVDEDREQAPRTAPPARASNWTCLCCRERPKGIRLGSLGRTPIDAIAVDVKGAQLKAVLERPGFRTLISSDLNAALDQRPDVVVGYSLGSVLTVLALAEREASRGRLGRKDNALLITPGSPLPISGVYRRLPPSVFAWNASRAYPWLNLHDTADLRVGGASLPPHRYPGVVNVRVINEGGRRHKIDEYLAHPVVAQMIHNWRSGHVPALADGRELGHLPGARPR